MLSSVRERRDNLEHPLRLRSEEVFQEVAKRFLFPANHSYGITDYPSAAIYHIGGGKGGNLVDGL